MTVLAFVIRADRAAMNPTCVAAFSQRRGVFDPTIECGRRARYRINGDELCSVCARRRCRALGIELPQLPEAVQ